MNSKIQCQALNLDWMRCRNKSIGLFGYHGDGELYDYDDYGPRSVAAYFCNKHSRNKKMIRGFSK